jgi:hypothetical protein
MTTKTIRPNTRVKDILKKKESFRIKKLAADKKALENLLSSIPKVDPLNIEPAVNELIYIADEYKKHLYIINNNNRKTKPKLSDERKGLNRIIKNLKSLQQGIQNLPTDATQILHRQYKNTTGSLTAELTKFSIAAENTLEIISKKPNREINHHRVVLAYQVSRVLIETLKIKASTTLESQLKKNSIKGGAAYDRILRATLKVAGVTQYDPKALIIAGLSTKP